MSEGMKTFFTGDAIKAELLVVMLEKHGISAEETFVHEPMEEGADEFSRETIVKVPALDYDRAHQLFYEDTGDEL